MFQPFLSYFQCFSPKRFYQNKSVSLDLSRLLSLFSSSSVSVCQRTRWCSWAKPKFALFPYNRLIQTKMSRLPWGYRDEEENMYMESLPLLAFFLVQQQSIFGIHWRYDSLACFLFQFHAGIAGNFASFLRYMHVFTKCLRIAVF